MESSVAWQRFAYVCSNKQTNKYSLLLLPQRPPQIKLLKAIFLKQRFVRDD